MTPAQGAKATFDQLSEAIESVSDADWLRLQKVAQSHLWGTGLSDPQDLINEALARFLKGKRSWPTDIPFVLCVSYAMKSIADGVRNLSERKEEILAGDMASEEDDCDTDPMERFGDSRFAPDDLIENEDARKIAEKDLATINQYFKDDSEVTWILMGIEDGLPASDIQTLSGMTQTQYETSRKRLRRGLEKLFPGRRKP
ncbi:MAG: sigma-70 family RNA polymerase sigma factor [Gammaproteobacteria bacterium]|nr:sigma-70 family RNA polymerase sigma factor [Gammaproteobacteria bacterium]